MFNKFCRSFSEKRIIGNWISSDLEFYELFLESIFKITRNALCYKEKNLNRIQAILQTLESPFKKWRRILKKLSVKIENNTKKNEIATVNKDPPRSHFKAKLKRQETHFFKNRLEMKEINGNINQYKITLLKFYRKIFNHHIHNKNFKMHVLLFIILS